MHRQRSRHGYGRHEMSGGRGHGRGRHRVRRGDVRSAILALLDDRPMHGYEMITELEERTGGRWRPSAGSIYPTLQLLEDEGLVTAEEVEGRKVYSLTDAGKKAAPERTEGQQALGGGRRGLAALRGPQGALQADRGGEATRPRRQRRAAHQGGGDPQGRPPQALRHPRRGVVSCPRWAVGISEPGRLQARPGDRGRSRPPDAALGAHQTVPLGVSISTPPCLVVPSGGPGRRACRRPGSPPRSRSGTPPTG